MIALFVLLEEVLKEIIQLWNPASGKITTDFLEPILAKLYYEDLKFKKKTASCIIGLDGTRGDKSTLIKRLSQYHNIIRIIQKNDYFNQHKNLEER